MPPRLAHAMMASGKESLLRMDLRSAKGFGNVASRTDGGLVEALPRRIAQPSTDFYHPPARVDLEESAESHLR